MISATLNSAISQPASSSQPAASQPAARAMSSPTSSPTSRGEAAAAAAAAATADSSAAARACGYSLAILQRFSTDARIKGVVRSENSKLVKLCPGTQGGGHTQLAALTALRMAFPFCSVSAVECAASGNTEFQILVNTDSESFVHAKRHYYEKRVFRALRLLSNTALLFSMLSFVCLLHAAAIRV